MFVLELPFSLFYSAELWFSNPWPVWFFRYCPGRKRNYVGALDCICDQQSWIHLFWVDESALVFLLT
jgi:hypothetical protein